MWKALRKLFACMPCVIMSQKWVCLTGEWLTGAANTTITTLNLGANNIGDKGAALLGEMLKVRLVLNKPCPRSYDCNPLIVVQPERTHHALAHPLR